jgi:hypothetical protein
MPALLESMTSRRRCHAVTGSKFGPEIPLRDGLFA